MSPNKTYQTSEEWVAVIKTHMDATDMEMASARHLDKILIMIKKSHGMGYSAFMYRARLSLGIDIRYIDQYLKGLEAWGVINCHGVISFTPAFKAIAFNEAPQEPKEPTSEELAQGVKDYVKSKGGK